MAEIENPKTDSAELNSEEKADHSISIRDYKTLQLASNEYVIVDVKRSKVGLVLIWAIVIAASLLMMVFCQMLIWTFSSLEATFLAVFFGYLVAGIVIVIGIIESRIYRNKYMIITNQRAFTQNQIGPFAVKSQTIELEHVEDVGVLKSGFLSMLLNYGEIRFSSERDDSAYSLTFVKNPEEQAVEIRKIVNIVDEG